MSRAYTIYSAVRVYIPFLQEYRYLKPTEILLKYLTVQVSRHREDSNLLKAELLYLVMSSLSHGEVPPVIYSETEDMWYTWDKVWRPSKEGNNVMDAFQIRTLHIFRELVDMFIDQASAQLPQETHPRVKVAKDMVHQLENRSQMFSLVMEARKFFKRDGFLFDTNAYLFAFSNNVVLDLTENTFRWSKPSDMCRRHSNLSVPISFLKNTFWEEQRENREQVLMVLQSIFRREGAFHPGDLRDILGDDADLQNYEWLLDYLCRVMEGIPLTKCLIVFSDRGRNSKGILEKIIEGLWGEYYAGVSSAIFGPPKENENDHDAMALDRQGRRVVVANEMSGQWHNASFKFKNSRDKVPARGCHSSTVVHYDPTHNIVFMCNDPPDWTNIPKGSEVDRLIVLRLPNKFVESHEIAGFSPRRFQKDASLDDKVRSTNFALGLLSLLVERRRSRQAEGTNLTAKVCELTPSIKFWRDVYAKQRSVPPTSDRVTESGQGPIVDIAAISRSGMPSDSGCASVGSVMRPEAEVSWKTALRAGVSSVPWKNVRDQSWIHTLKSKRQPTMKDYLLIAPDLFTKNPVIRTATVVKGEEIRILMPAAPQDGSMFPQHELHRGKGCLTYKEIVNTVALRRFLESGKSRRPGTDMALLHAAERNPSRSIIRKHTYSSVGYGRRYALPFHSSLQGVTREARRAALQESGCTEIDIANAYPTLMLQMLHRIAPRISFPSLADYVSRRQYYLGQIQALYAGIDRQMAKGLFLRLQHGGTFEQWAAAVGCSDAGAPVPPEWVGGFHLDCQAASRILANTRPELLERFRKRPKPHVSATHYIIAEAEDACLQILEAHWLDSVRALQFDGLQVEQSIDVVRASLPHLEANIRTMLGWNVTLTAQEDQEVDWSDDENEELEFALKDVDVEHDPPIEVAIVETTTGASDAACKGSGSDTGEGPRKRGRRDKLEFLAVSPRHGPDAPQAYSVAPEVLAMLKQLATDGENCTPWCVLVLHPAIHTNLRFGAVLGQSGPYTYGEIAELCKESLTCVSVSKDYLRLHSGAYLAHQGARGASTYGHCEALLVLDKDTALKIYPDDAGAPVWKSAVISSLCADYFIQLVDVDAGLPSDLQHIAFKERAGGRSGDLIRASDAGIQIAVKAEVAYWMAKCNAYGQKAKEFGRGRKWRCPMCPTRMTTRKDYLKRHMTNYHAQSQAGSNPLPVRRSTQREPASKPVRKDHLLVLGTRSRKQRALMRGMWNRDQIEAATAAIFGEASDVTTNSRYLERSATAIRQQLHMSKSFRQRRVELEDVCVGLDQEMVVLLDKNTTRYMLKDDACSHHRIGSKFYATDAYLSEFTAWLLDPDINSARCLVRRMAEEIGPYPEMLPAPQGTVLLGLIESIVEHPVIRDGMVKCRAAASKAVLSIDAQYKTMQDVLYQIPHGQQRGQGNSVGHDEAHCIHTVRGSDTVLLTTVRATEGFHEQLLSLREAVNAPGMEPGNVSDSVGWKASGVQLIFSDAPVNLDRPELFAHFPDLVCIAMDPIHVALKVEQATGGAKNACSVDLRRCLLKFACPTEDGLACFKNGDKLDRTPTLAEVQASMTPARAQQLVDRIRSDAYTDEGYACVADFVLDVAALIVKHPSIMRRRTGKGCTVASSLKYATSNLQLQYLFNGSRYRARHPGVPVHYGTTGCEATHSKLSNFFQGTTQKSVRFARAWTTVFNVRMLVLSVVRRLPLSIKFEPVQLLARAACAVGGLPLMWHPRVAQKTTRHGSVDIASLPKHTKLSAIHRAQR